MKRTARKWLSLLMAFALVLSLMPAALAEREEVSFGWSTEAPEGHKHERGNEKTDSGKVATCTEDGYKVYSCKNKIVESEDETDCSATFTEKIDKKGHTWDDGSVTKEATCKEKGVKIFTCSVCKEAKTEEIPMKEHGRPENSNSYTQNTTAKTHTYKCTAGNEDITEDCSGTWSDAKDGTHSMTCTYCGATYTGSHDYNDSGKCKVCDARNDRTAVSISGSMEMKVDETKSIEFTFYDKYEVPTTDTIRNLEYEVDSRYDDCVSITSNGKIYGEYAGTARIVVYDQDGGALGYVTVKVTGTSKSDFTVTASVSAGTSGYALGDDDDDNGSSIIEQINKKLKSNEWIEDIWFTSVSHTNGKLNADKGSSSSDRYAYSESEAEDVVFTPDKSVKKGDTAVFYATVYAGKTTKKYYDVTISLKIIDGASSDSDITYTSELGKDVSFRTSDFEDFWTDTYSSGTLDYVKFGSVSGGSLKDGDGKSAGSSSFYANPSRSSHKDLDDVYFEPNNTTSKKATTIKIRFTAYGTQKKSSGDRELSGTVVITYLNGDIDDITYTTNSNGKVTLKSSDFTDVFKKATGSSGTLTITFTSLPSNGTLTYGSKDTKVTKSTTFKTSGAGNKIADVTYTASGSKSDTVTYTAASGSTKITGKILFNSVAANISLTVPYTCTSASGITFSTGDFTSRASGLTGSHSLAFGQPSGGNGGLYYTAIASQIPAGTKIPVSTLNTVTYRPSSNGATTIAFIIYDASGLVAGSGSVTITVSGVTGGTANPGNPGNPGTTTPGGVDSFKDVNATAWYRTDLTRLVSLGIMAGRSPNKFAPEGTLNYGEALKLICKAVGVTQPEGSGAQWAANYKSYAVSQGWITSDVVLTDTITRTAIAQIGAKALGLSASSATPFPDTNDPYVAAMNTAGIILGNPDGNFNGSGNLKRSEICAIICRMLNYRDNAYNDQIPGWL